MIPRRWFNIGLPSCNTLHSTRIAAKTAWPWHMMGRERACIYEYCKTYHYASSRLEPPCPLNYEGHVTIQFWSFIRISFHAFIGIVCIYCRIRCFTYSYLIFVLVLTLSLWLWLVTVGLGRYWWTLVGSRWDGTRCYHQLIGGRNVIVTTLSFAFQEVLWDRDRFPKKKNKRTQRSSPISGGWSWEKALWQWRLVIPYIACVSKL